MVNKNSELSEICIFENIAKNVVPESLQPVFKEEFSEIIESVRKILKINNELFPDKMINFEKQSERRLKFWSKEKLVSFGYSRYKKMVTTPVTLPFYRFLNEGVYSSLRYLENNNMKIGSKVVGINSYEGEAGIISNISKFCGIYFENRKGEFKASDWTLATNINEPLKENE